MTQVQEIALDQLAPSPFNPRTVFKGPKFDELVASIEKVGVLEPILARPKDDAFEIVAGERRWRASCTAAKKNGGLSAHTIPALVRELDDDQAFEIQTIENLQREDLTGLEEAQAFKFYVDRHGEEAISELADRTGIKPGYIHRRLRLFNLPKNVLKAWGAGKLKFGHLEQLMRLGDKKEVLKYYGEIVNDTWGHHQPVSWLKDQIDEKARKLAKAIFNRKTAGCTACTHNSDVQARLFDEDDLKGSCLNGKCFKKNTNDHLLKTFKQTKMHRKFHTTGFRFQNDMPYDTYERFYNKAPKACHDCESFVSFVDGYGQATYQEQVCIGDKACFKKATTAAKSTTSTSSKRPNRHGELFRERFFQSTLPERIISAPVETHKLNHTLLYGLLQINAEACVSFSKRHGLMEQDANSWDRPNDKTLFRTITALSDQDSLTELRLLISEIVTQPVLSTDERWMIAEHLGIDLSKQFVIDEDYLKKKTIKEILALGEALGVFQEQAAQTFLFEKLLKKRGKFETCKKAELIKVFLESGVDLAGRVPEEILSDHPLSEDPQQP